MKRFAPTIAVLLLGFVYTLHGAAAQPRAAAQPNTVYIPLALGTTGAAAPPLPAPSPSPTPVPSPPSGTVPTALAGTWFTGALLPRTLYDPSTGQWGSANGLGQTFEFATNGSFAYLAFFRVENPGCASEVSVYRQGTVDAAGASLTLRPVTVKTRTVTYCGTRNETVTDGPYDAQAASWFVDVDNAGAERLTLTIAGTATEYKKLGMAEALVGNWRRGDIQSVGFYDPSSGVFTTSPSEGWWLSIAADGTYRWGEVGHTSDQHGCALTAWLYLEGQLSVAGSHVTFSPTRGVARVENACTPTQPRQEPWNEDAKGFTWLLRDRQTSPQLVLIPDGRFQEFVFTPE